MTSLRGYAQLLCRLLDGGRIPDPGLLVRALRTIDVESEKLVQLTGQLLDVSRVEAGKLRLERRHVDLTSVVSAAAAAAQAGTDRHTLRLQLLDECPAFVDPIRFEQVAANLLSNAIKYSPDGGEIDVVLCRDAAAQSVRLEVRDRGIGIPLERRAGLFERFYQAHGDGNFGGLGLGLYISQQIVQLHGGRIEADFPADGGTRIAVTVPLSA